MADFTLKAGDLEPPLSIQLVDMQGVPVDVSTALSVKCRIAPVGSRVEVFAHDVELEIPAIGSFYYPWNAGETDVPGTYYAEFVVEWPTGRIQTFPSEGYLVISIEPKL